MRTQIKYSKDTIPHEYQDKKYGKNMRVCNKMKTESNQPEKWRDTVTGKQI